MFSITSTILLLALPLAIVNCNIVTVDTSSGLVQGKRVDTKYGSVIQFLNIPYADQPQRFQLSKPILHEEHLSILSEEDEETVRLRNLKHRYHHHYNPNDVLGRKESQGHRESGSTMASISSTTKNHTSINNLNQEGQVDEGIQNACPQPSHLHDFKHPSVPHAGESLEEDCLKLHIYAPLDIEFAYDKGVLYPILVWVPGDGFSFGDPIHYDGTALASRGQMLVITINYRVGVFGFLSTGDNVLPGNAGLSDILSALQWIHENGKAFRGDVANITLGGRFSGSMAVSMLMSSPTFTKTLDKSIPTLAKRLILHGGIATSPWVIETSPIEPALKLIGLTNCKKNHSTTLNESVECLKSLPVKQLLGASMKVPEMFRPVIDNQIILRDPMDSIYYGIIPENVEFLIGDNTGSGSLCYQRHVYTKGNLLPKIQQNIVNEDDLRWLIQDDLIAYYNIDDEGFAAIVTHEYLYPIKTNTRVSLRDIYTHFCGMLFLRNPTESTAGYISRFGRNDVFRYELDGKFESEPSSRSMDTPKWLETTTGNEILFLFPTNEHEMTIAEETISMKMSDAYINFVRSGHPGNQWPLFNEETKKLIRFTPNGSVNTTSFYLEREIHFWRDSVSKLVSSHKKWAAVSSISTNITMLDDAINKPTPPPLADNNVNKICLESVEHHQSFTAAATNYFLAFLIFAGICVAIGLGVHLYRVYRKHRMLFG